MRKFKKINPTPLLLRLVNGIEHITYYIIGILVLGYLLLGVQICTAQNQFERIEARYQSIIKERLETFTTIPGNLSIEPERLEMILRGDLSQMIEINDELIKKHFSGQENPEIAEIVYKWGLSDVSKIPFFIDVREVDNQLRRYFIIPSSIFNLPDSSFIYYVTFFKAYSNLSDHFKSKPCPLAFGICSLIAQEVTYRSSMAACPEFEEEAAIVNLLYLYKPGIVWNTFSGFNIDSYRADLLDVISKIQGKSTGIDQYVEKLLSPSKKVYLLGNLRGLLSGSATQITKILEKVSQINNLTMRFILLNVCYDQMFLKEEDKFNPRFKLKKLVTSVGYNYEDNSFPEGPQKTFCEKIKNIRQSIKNEFYSELGKRNQDLYNVRNISFDPATFKWVFTFLFNYSLDFTEKVCDFERKEGPIEDITRKQTEKWIRSDGLLNELLGLPGRPDILLRLSNTQKKGKELSLKWFPTRRKANISQEEIELQIIDPFGSGGGKPVKGVSVDAQVLVKRTLESEPEIISLGRVQAGYFVRSLDQWRDIPSSRLTWVQVVSVKQHKTGIYQLYSGDGTLKVAPDQEVLATENQRSWRWRRGSSLREQTDYLLAMGDATQNGPAAHPVSLIRNDEDPNEMGVVELCLSREGQGAYFADSRLVAALVAPPVLGIESEARIEVPEGGKKLKKLSVADVVHAFEFENPEIFKDRVYEITSALEKFYITIAYRFEDGSGGRIRAAKDQPLFVYDTHRGVVTARAARDLKKGQKLVTAFRNGPPKTADIIGFSGKKQRLAICNLALKQLGVVRINGILVPVPFKKRKAVDGVLISTKIQMPPSSEKLRNASKFTIDLSDARSKMAGNLKVGNDPLSYKAMVKQEGEEQYFFHGRIAGVKPYPSTRYLKIVTDKTALICGHLQKIYVIPRGETCVDICEARELEVGDKLIFLQKPGLLRRKSTIKHVPIRNIQNKYSIENKRFVSVGYGKDNIYGHKEAANILGNMFANGIMVRLDPCGPGYGMGEGGKGPHAGKIPRPLSETPTQKYQRTYRGIIQHIPGLKMKVHFRDRELKSFEKIENDLKLYRANLKNLHQNLNIRQINREQFANFIKNYFHFYNRGREVSVTETSIKGIYKQIDSDLETYLNARDILLTTGAIEIVPAIINEYSYLCFLLYSAGVNDVADVLTRDVLSIITTILSREEGKRYYRENKLNIRDAIILLRDLILYVREGCIEEGVEGPMNTKFSAEGFDSIIEYFENKENFSRDICSAGQINLHNFWRQMDKWSGKELPLLESILVPQFDPSENMEGNNLTKALEIKYRYVRPGRED